MFLGEPFGAIVRCLRQRKLTQMVRDYEIQKIYIKKNNFVTLNCLATHESEFNNHDKIWH